MFFSYFSTFVIFIHKIGEKIKLRIEFTILDSIQIYVSVDNKEIIIL